MTSPTHNAATVKPCPRTRIKICGLTREEDVDAVADAGVDAVGFVLYPPSVRHVTAKRAALATVYHARVVVRQRESG